MKNLISSLYSVYRNIKSKIAFYPTLFALTGLLFAFIMMYLEKRGISDYLIENAPFLVVNNGDTAMVILSACITGLISMMVFSFSMVMLLLNQAASNYSPRLLPGLISDYRHQIILGVYLFSILYCIFILFYIQPTGDKYQMPGFAVLLGILATVISIYAFIYFIHNISQSIQISHILDEIFITAKKQLNVLIEKEKEEEAVDTFPDSKEWYEYKTDKSGYFQDFTRDYLLNFSKEKNTRLSILPVQGMFVLRGIPVIRSEKELTDDELKEIFGHFHFTRGELVHDNYVLAFKQITEVIVKAMSPGINDPGTALNAIDYLSELLQMRMQLSDESYVADEGKIHINLRAVNFEELLYNILASLRTYCKHDIVVVQKIGIMFYYLSSQEARHSYYHDILSKEAKRLLKDAGKDINNETDLETIDKLRDKLNLKLEKGDATP